MVSIMFMYYINVLFVFLLNVIIFLAFVSVETGGPSRAQ